MLEPKRGRGEASRFGVAPSFEPIQPDESAFMSSAVMMSRLRCGSAANAGRNPAARKRTIERRRIFMVGPSKLG